MTVPQFKLDAVLIDQLVSILRDIGRLLVSDLLTALDDPQANRHSAPDLQPVFPREHWRWLAKNFKPGRQSKRTAKPTAQVIETALRADTFNQSSWEKYAAGRLRNDLDPVYGLPDVVWQFIGEIAWQDIMYYYDLNEMVQAAFRTRTLFEIGGRRQTRFSSQTFWFLIALIGEKPDDTGQNPFVTRALNQFAAVGRLQASVPGWGSWWDQWLILQAMVVWDNRVITSEMASKFQSFPLCGLLEAPAPEPCPPPDGVSAANTKIRWRKWLYARIRKVIRDILSRLKDAITVVMINRLKQSRLGRWVLATRSAKPVRLLDDYSAISIPNINPPTLLRPDSPVWDRDIPRWFRVWFLRTYTNKENPLW